MVTADILNIDLIGKMETLGFEFEQFTSYWSLFGDLKIFNIQRQMYDYDCIKKQMKRLERLYENRVNPLDSLEDPDNIKSRFRLLPHRIIDICNLLEPSLKPKSNRNNPLSVLTQVCTALLYYGTGNSKKF